MNQEALGRGRKAMLLDKAEKMLGWKKVGRWKEKDRVSAVSRERRIVVGTSASMLSWSKDSANLV
jgi:hypothetical protein